MVSKPFAVPLLLTGMILSGPSHAAPVVSIPSVDFVRLETSAGGVIDTLPAETLAGRDNLVEVFSSHLGRRGFEFRPFPELSAEQERVYWNHAAAVETVVNQKIANYTNLRYRGQLARMQTSVGPGLGFLADEYGIDKVVVVSGAELSLTGFRAALVLASIAAFRVALDAGGTFMMAALVDTRTGDIEWAEFQRNYRDDESVHLPEGAALLANRMFVGYPHSRLTPERRR